MPAIDEFCFILLLLTHEGFTTYVVPKVVPDFFEKNADFRFRNVAKEVKWLAVDFERKLGA